MGNWIQTLQARGRWLARYMHDGSTALEDLNEALDKAVIGGYRINEFDIRVGLAWVHLIASDKYKVAALENAKEEAVHAKKMSKEKGYY